MPEQKLALERVKIVITLCVSLIHFPATEMGRAKNANRAAILSMTRIRFISSLIHYSFIQSNIANFFPFSLHILRIDFFSASVRTLFEFVFVVQFIILIIQYTYDQ